MNRKSNRNRNRYDRFDYFGVAVYACFMALLIGVLCLAEFGIAHLVSEDKAVNAAQASGLSNVQVTAAHRAFVVFHGCGKDDLAEFDVTGVNNNGQTVHAHVCAGLLKGTTVRY